MLNLFSETYEILQWLSVRASVFIICLLLFAWMVMVSRERRLSRLGAGNLLGTGGLGKSCCRLSHGGPTMELRGADSFDCLESTGRVKS